MVRRPSLHWLSAKVTVHGKEGQECHGSGLWAAHSPSSPGPGLMSQDTPTDPESQRRAGYLVGLGSWSQHPVVLCQSGKASPEAGKGCVPR